MFKPKVWALRAPKGVLQVGVGEMLASNQAAAVLTTYSLGSCVAVVAYDPASKVGGMLHAMLPDSGLNLTRAAERPHMFVDTGIPLLFRAVYELGGLRSRLIVKLVGGAEMLNDSRAFNIGVKNVEAAREVLQRNRLHIHASDTGGYDIRTLRLDLGSGELSVEVIGKGVRNL